MRRFGKWLGWIVAIGCGFMAIVAWFGPRYVESSRNAVSGSGAYPVSADTAALHETLLVGDWHADSLLWDRDLTKRSAYGQVDIPRLLAGNVGLQVFTAVTKSPAGQNYDANSSEAYDNITTLAIGQLWPPRTWTSLLERALYQAEKLEAIEAKMPGEVKIIRTRSDLDEVLAARETGKKVIGAILGVEGAHPLELKIENLDKLEAAGHRVIGLQHFFDNGLGGSLHGLSNRGLTDFGRDVVTEAIARGMIIDLAHSSPAVARDVVAITNAPVIVSHTGVAAFCDVKRNFPDDLMRDIAATGGVIGMGYWAEVACGDIDPAGIARMIRTAMEVVGEDHVSLGSDFDGSVTTAFDASQMAALTHALIAEGLTEDQIRKVMGGNMVRVLRTRLPG